MKILNKTRVTTYVIELDWIELRDLSNALHDALQSRFEPVLECGDRYPDCEYKRLQDTILEALRHN